MKSNAKKIILSSIITLLVSAGFTHAADTLSQHADRAPMATTISTGELGQVMPCTTSDRSSIEAGEIRQVMPCTTSDR